MLLIDASVIVTILTATRFSIASTRIMAFLCISVVRMEASTFALTRRRAEALGRDTATPAMLEESRQVVIDPFLLDLEAKEALISGDVGSKALDAAQQFCKIVSHPEKLDMGDCFS